MMCYMKYLLSGLVAFFAFLVYGQKGLETPESGWKQLTNLKQAEVLLTASSTKPILIFKHSTACNISAAAKRELEKAKISTDECDAYYLDLLTYRAVSTKIETITGVKHESPQVIIWSGGKVIYTASHKQILGRTIKKELKL